jgi:hypothetical protein
MKRWRNTKLEVGKRYLRPAQALRFLIQEGKKVIANNRFLLNALMMTEAVSTSETSVYFNKTTLHYIPEGCHLDALSLCIPY